jgi:hypothetical protein
MWFSRKKEPPSDKFQEYFGIPEGEVRAILTQNLPDKWTYTLRATQFPVEGAPSRVFGFALEGSKTPDDKNILYLVQKIDLGAKVAKDSDISVPQKDRGSGAGMLLRYNSLELFRRLGVERAEISTANMGGYAWARYGALMDLTMPGIDMLRRQMREDFDFLAKGIPLEERKQAERRIHLSYPTDHWGISDLSSQPLVENLPKEAKALREVFLKHTGGIDASTPEEIKVADRMAAKVSAISRYYDMRPDQMSLGLLLLYGTYWKGNFYLRDGQHEDQAAQWERIEMYMARKFGKAESFSKPVPVGFPGYEKN